MSFEGGVEHQQLRLGPGEARELQVTVTAPEGFVGRQAINLNGFDGSHLVGGVTLIAHGATDD